MSLRTPPRGAGKTSSASGYVSRCDCNISTALDERGTRWTTLAFMRLAGTVQTAVSRSISSQRILRASPDRAAVRTTNSKRAREEVAFPLYNTSRKKAGISRHGMAGWCCTRIRLPVFCGKRCSTTSTGLPETIPCAQHHFITAWQRCRTREAVSDLANQIGRNASAKSLGERSATF